MCVTVAIEQFVGLIALRGGKFGSGRGQIACSRPLQISCQTEKQGREGWREREWKGAGEQVLHQ